MVFANKPSLPEVIDHSQVATCLPGALRLGIPLEAFLDNSSMKALMMHIEVSMSSQNLGKILTMGQSLRVHARH